MAIHADEAGARIGWDAVTDLARTDGELDRSFKALLLVSGYATKGSPDRTRASVVRAIEDGNSPSRVWAVASLMQASRGPVVADFISAALEAEGVMPTVPEPATRVLSSMEAAALAGTTSEAGTVELPEWATPLVTYVPSALSAYMTIRENAWSQVALPPRTSTSY